MYKGMENFEDRQEKGAELTEEQHKTLQKYKQIREEENELAFKRRDAKKEEVVHVTPSSVFHGNKNSQKFLKPPGYLVS